jgi:hypothetical protein
MRIPFGTQSYQHQSLPLSAQRMVNCYLEPAPPHAKTFAAVIAAFGVAAFTTVGSGSLRGAKVVRGTLYVVSGTSLYRVSSSGAATTLGTIAGTGFVFIEGDETNVMVVEPESQDGWYWNGTTVAQITDTDWPGAVWLGYIDGYFAIIAPDSGQFFVTANRNPASIDALDFASAERYPDDLVTGIVDHGEMILFGTESGEGFFNSGNADFPLSRIQAASFEVGCLCPRGPQKLDNSIFFPGSDGRVYRLNGYVPQVISTPVVEQAIARATDRNFIGLAWKEPGHDFYALKSADFAFVFDISSGLWHERASHGLSAWRWEFVLRAYEQWIVGDSQSNALGTLSADTFTEFGETMRVEATSPPVGNDNERVTHSCVELVFEQGVGAVSGNDADPQCMLQFSDDGGRTWSSERWRSIGRMGKYKHRARWFRNGKARDRIYRYAMSAAVRRNLILATTKARA